MLPFVHELMLNKAEKLLNAKESEAGMARAGAKARAQMVWRNTEIDETQPTLSSKAK